MSEKIPLQGKGILTTLQKDFLAAFSRLADQEQFYLTGGTALAEYYLAHRRSFDLDFFTGVDALIQPMSYQVERLEAPRGVEIAVVRRFATYTEFLVTQGTDSLRVDLALDSPFRFAPPLLSEHGIWVNDYQDLQVDKLLAYYGRAEPRDAVDLFFILQQTPLESLIRQAAQKDPGFDLYWFAVALDRSAGFPDEAERWPVEMLVAFEPARVKALFASLALEIMRNTRNDQTR